MASNSETGHAINVANLESLSTSANRFGPVYNPSNPLLTVDSMTNLLQNANDAMNLVNVAKANDKIAKAARDVAFDSLSSLTTRIMNALGSCGVGKLIINSARTIVRKIQGVRATPKLSTEEKEALQADGIVKKEVSSSQMNFDSRLSHFDELIQLLPGIPQYAPNEEELKVSSLTNYYNTLKTANSAALATDTQWSNARLSRNEILYF